MKTLKRILSVVLVAAVLFCMNSASFAVENSGGKEEVVYATLDADGNVTGIYVVNIFDGGRITDYGRYTDVRNLTTKDAINVNGDEITVSASENKLYYEGTLESRDIPWNISIKYFMDGQEYSPEDVAGKSGKLGIRIAVTQNQNCGSTFFENYALQVSVKLDTQRCTGIKADGATEADVGSDKQLSYIILPGNEKELVITANTTDFEMKPIEINGLLMNLGGDINIDADSLGLSGYEASISELQDGVRKLDDSAGKIKDGAAGLEKGVSDLAGGVRNLYAGLAALDGSSGDILSGAQQLADAIFASATAQLRTQLAAAGMSEAEAAQITLTRDNYVSVVSQLSGGTPTESQTALAESTIRVQLSSAGITDKDQQNLAMTLAENILAAGDKSTVNGALSSAGLLMADAAYVQKAVAAYSSDPVAGTLTAALTADPYNMDPNMAAMVARTAVALDASDPSVQITNAAAKVRNAAIVSGTVADSGSVRGLCTAAVQERMAGAADDFAALKTQLDGVVSFLNGLKTYTDGVTDAAAGANSVASGASGLKNGASALLTGAAGLADGTGELRTKTGSFDTNLTSTLQGKIDNVISDYSSDDFAPVSFVSDKNKNVKSVQFVIKAEAVELPEAVTVQEETAQKLTFWQKLLRLFGLY